jgi:hypothetical protein
MRMTTQHPDRKCPECGAPLGSAETCEELFHTALAMEWEEPLKTAAAHHLLVGTYMVQHPSRYTPEGRTFFASMVIDAVDQELSAHELYQHNRGRFDQQKRDWHIRAKEPDEPRLREWRMTIADVIDGPSLELPQRVWQWARGVREELG